MQIDETLVCEIAQLARLELTSADVTAIAPQLARILAHVDRIQEIDLGETEPTDTTLAPISLDDLREDAIGETLDPMAVLRGAPAHDGAFLVVPRFFDAQEGE